MNLLLQTTQPSDTYTSLAGLIGAITGMITAITALYIALKANSKSAEVATQSNKNTAVLQTTNQATAALIDVNKLNPVTPDIDQSLEAAVKQNALPSIDVAPPSKATTIAFLGCFITGAVSAVISQRW